MINYFSSEFDGVAMRITQLTNNLQSFVARSRLWIFARTTNT
jgi:hypothetical protein